MTFLATRRRAAPLLLLTAALLSTGALAAEEADQLVIFGDSLSDPGNFFVWTGDFVTPPFDIIPDAPYAIGGHHFSNGNTWVEQLATDLKVPTSAGPATRLPGKSTNYAFGGARARMGASSFPMFDLSWQVDRFLDDFDGDAPSGATYVIWIGGNDVRDALASLSEDPTGATAAAIVQEAVGSIADNVFGLYEHGARRFLVVGAPNIGLTPAVRALGAGNPAIPVLAEQLSVAFNGGLSFALDSLEAVLPDVRIRRLDTFSLINAIVADPEAAGLTEAERPCLTFGVRGGAICSVPNGYLFWDGIHPTRAGHARVAAAALEVLAGP